MTAKEVEKRVNAALDLIEDVASSNNVRFNNAMKLKLHKAEMILVTLTGLNQVSYETE